MQPYILLPSLQVLADRDAGQKELGKELCRSQEESSEVEAVLEHLQPGRSTAFMLGMRSRAGNIELEQPEGGRTWGWLEKEKFGMKKWDLARNCGRSYFG